MRIIIVLAALAGLGLVACGNTTEERAASGGLLAVPPGLR